MSKYIKGSNQFKKHRKPRYYFAKFLMICFGLMFLYGVFSYISPAKIKYERQEVILDNLIGKINELKGDLIGDIRDCERAGHKESDGLIIFDSNKVASIGTYQFQVKTVQYYYKTLYQKEITGKEAILIALDDTKAGDLARDIIFKTDKGLTNWHNCTIKTGAKDKLNIIKLLTN